MNKEEFKNNLRKVIDVLNEVDPEGLRPGKANGSPQDEYESEATRILTVIFKNSAISKEDLEVEINKIWVEMFDANCLDADLLAEKLLTYFDTES